MWPWLWRWTVWSEYAHPHHPRRGALLPGAWLVATDRGFPARWPASRHTGADAARRIRRHRGEVRPARLPERFQMAGIPRLVRPALLRRRPGVSAGAAARCGRAHRDRGAGGRAAARSAAACDAAGPPPIAAVAVWPTGRPAPRRRARPVGSGGTALGAACRVMARYPADARCFRPRRLAKPQPTENQPTGARPTRPQPTRTAESADERQARAETTGPGVSPASRFPAQSHGQG